MANTHDFLEEEEAEEEGPTTKSHFHTSRRKPPEELLLKNIALMPKFCLRRKKKIVFKRKDDRFPLNTFGHRKSSLICLRPLLLDVYTGRNRRRSSEAVLVTTRDCRLGH